MDDQLATKGGKKCNSEICSIICENSNGADETDEADSGGDFVDCEKCGLSIHKICFKLNGDLLKIFQDFERRNEKFPFTILCSECRQFTDKNNNEVQVQVVDSCEERDNLKNPFQIDCIVNVIVDHLNIQDLVNVRLVNKLWNQTACRILSKESRQDQLEAYNVNVKREGQGSGTAEELENCLQIVKSSDQKKLMQKWIFGIDGDQDYKMINNDFQVFNEIVTITKPASVMIVINDEVKVEKVEQNTLFSTFLTNISENVVDLWIHFRNEIHFDQTQFCSMPKFSKLKTITIKDLQPDNYKFVKMVIENSPKLINLALSSYPYCDDDEYLVLNDYINKNRETDICVLSEKFTQNLQMLKLSTTSFNFETFKMKLKTLSLRTDYLQYIKFVKMNNYLASQNATLENLKITFQHDKFVPLNEIEDLETGRMNLPRLENVQQFYLAFEFDKCEKVCNTKQEIWPVKPINLAGKLPNLKKISLTYSQNWALSFETGQNSHHPGVTELVLKKWTDGDLAKLVELFPQVKFLNLKKFCFNTKDKCDGEKIYTYLNNLNGWSESLRRIEISCEYYHLEHLDFEKLVCLTNLESIKISKTNGQGSDVISSHFIYPDFTPLYKIATLSQVAIKNFKISKGIVEDLREKYPSLDYSFYPIPIKSGERERVYHSFYFTT